MQSKTLSWGIETETGKIWSETRDTRKEMVQHAEWLFALPWREIVSRFGVKAIKVLIIKVDTAIH